MGAARCRSMNLRMLLPVGQRGGFCDNRGDRNGLTMDDTVDDDLNYSTATPTSTLRLLLMRVEKATVELDDSLLSLLSVAFLSYISLTSNMA